MSKYKLQRLPNEFGTTQAQVIRKAEGEIVVTPRQLSFAKRCLENLNKGLHPNAS